MHVASSVGPPHGRIRGAFRPPPPDSARLPVASRPPQPQAPPFRPQRRPTGELHWRRRWCLPAHCVRPLVPPSAVCQWGWDPPLRMVAAIRRSLVSERIGDTDECNDPFFSSISSSFSFFVPSILRLEFPLQKIDLESKMLFGCCLPKTMTLQRPVTCSSPAQPQNCPSKSVGSLMFAPAFSDCQATECWRPPSLV